MLSSYCYIKLPTLLHDTEFAFAPLKVSKEKDRPDPNLRELLSMPLQGKA